MADIAKAAESADERFLTFKSEGRFYALPAALVSEIARMPPLARVPQAPRSLLGCHSACNIDPLSRGIGVQN
jgi:purine-binding chemotaxis protein CheW